MRTLVKVGARNERENLPGVLATLVALQQRHAFNILVVDDGSDDGTTDIIRSYERGVELFHVLTPLGISYGNRLVLKRALSGRYDACVSLDGDGQHDPQLLPAVLAALEGGVEFVHCSRFADSEHLHKAPLDRRLLRDAVNGMVHQYAPWEPLTDVLCGFWGLRRTLIERLLPAMKVEGYGFQIELVIRAFHLNPRPRRMEIEHPVIYRNGTTRLDDLYVEHRLAERLPRFSMHAQHVHEVVRDMGLDR